mgnify:CR=1 FL=1
MWVCQKVLWLERVHGLLGRHDGRAGGEGARSDSQPAWRLAHLDDEFSVTVVCWAARQRTPRPALRSPPPHSPPQCSPASDRSRVLSEVPERACLKNLSIWMVKSVQIRICSLGKFVMEVYTSNERQGHTLRWSVHPGVCAEGIASHFARQYGHRLAQQVSCWSPVKTRTQGTTKRTLALGGGSAKLFVAQCAETAP